MKDSVKIFLFALCFSIVLSNHVMGDPTEPEATISNLIADLMQSAPRRKLARDKGERDKLAGEIVDAAKVYNLDPILITMLAYFESSFHTSDTGGIGEVGIMQMHGRAVTTCPHDVTTRAGQILCGARWFRLALIKCEDDEAAALTAYASGSCTPRTVATREKIAYRVRRIERARK